MYQTNYLSSAINGHLSFSARKEWGLQTTDLATSEMIGVYSSLAVEASRPLFIVRYQ